jgi:proteasome accessory factor A
MAHFITRQIYTGAGKVASEAPGISIDEVPFQLTQRADFFEEEVGLETTLKRPIINTRDEPHGDPSQYRRLHVILGDANLSEYQIFLKLGSTALVLAALEDGAIPDSLDLADPVKIWRVTMNVVA